MKLPELPKGSFERLGGDFAEPLYTAGEMRLYANKALQESQQQNAALKRQLEEARKDAEELRELIRHTYPDNSYRLQIDFGDFHIRNIVTAHDAEHMGVIAQHAFHQLNAAIAAQGEK